jgi:hypothetical protein
MAITLSKQPDNISPVFADNKFIMSESGSDYFTLTFSGDVSGTFKIFPNTLGIAEFNARYLLENYIYSQIALPETSPLPNGLKNYTISIQTSQTLVENIGPFYFFNGALQEREGNRAFNGFVLNSVYKENPELVSYFNGVDSKLIFTDLTGVNIVRYEGTSTLSIVGNEIIGTQGTCYNLLLDNGEFYALPHTGVGETVTFEALFNGVWNDSANWNDNDIWNDN